jgi:hypothetical protein
LLIARKFRTSYLTLLWVGSSLLQITMSSTSSFRGGFAPRRGQGGWKKPFVKSKREYVKPDTSKNPLGQLLKTLGSSDLRIESANSFGDTPISDVQYAASYNWRGGGSNTILVPGMLINICVPKIMLMSSRQAPAMDTSQRCATPPRRQRTVLPRPKCCKISRTSYRTCRAVCTGKTT